MLSLVILIQDEQLQTLPRISHLAEIHFCDIQVIFVSPQDLMIKNTILAHIQKAPYDAFLLEGSIQSIDFQMDLEKHHFHLITLK